MEERAAVSESTSPDGAGLIDSVARVATWNVWGNFGPWRERCALIQAELRRTAPDVICLQETWRADGYDSAAVLAK
jgi:endonuclease/exonuclease/phosphatase family metal-dependent hydrolase